MEELKERIEKLLKDHMECAGGGCTDFIKDLLALISSYTRGVIGEDETSTTRLETFGEYAFTAEGIRNSLRAEQLRRAGLLEGGES